MLTTFAARTDSSAIAEDALVLGVFEGARTLDTRARRADGTLGGAGALLLDDTFAGKRAETRVASIPNGSKLRTVVLVGLGSRERANAEELMDAGGAAARALLAARATSAAIVLATDDAELLQAFARGMALAPYAYGLSARKKPRALKSATFLTARTTGTSAALARAHLIASLMTRVRDWVNTPANLMSPAGFAGEARSLLAAHGVSCRVWKKSEIEKAGLGGVLAVARGSREEPRFLVAEHRTSERKLPLVCLIGKGVTFDTGGISIKPWEKMHEMKSDMAGGASVVAALAAIAQLKIPVRAVALVPIVENMPDGDAFRPGDILTLRSGKTVEVLTTDAEGRIILADAVAYACDHYQPDAIVDMATLTGGVVVALGLRIAGMMGNSARDLDDLRAAALAAGEPVWELPYDEYYQANVRGDVSDLKNYAGRAGSPITGGAMIGAFAEKTPWVHIDIAGTSWNEGGGPAWQTRGATGYGVDLLVRYAERVAARGSKRAALKSSARRSAPAGSRKPRTPSRRRRSSR